MIKYLSCLVFMTLLHLGAHSQKADIQQIEQVFRDEEKAWSAGDIDAYVNMYSPDGQARMLLSNKDVTGRDSILAFYKKYWPKERMGKLILDKTTIDILSSEYAYVTGRFTVSYADGRPTVTGRFSGLMRKVNNKWYIYTDHSG